jgi:hypothetical protein
VALASAGRRSIRSIARAAGIVLGTGLVVPGLVFGWLASRGGLAAFLDLFAGYVVPLYRHVGRTSAVEAIRWHPFGRPLWSLLLLLGILALLAAPTLPVRKGLVAAGALYGTLHFLVQGKGWEYQLYPLALFLCALAPWAVSRLRETGWPRALDLWGSRRAVALATWVLLVIVLGAKGVDAREPDWITAKAARVAALTHDLGPLVPAGATVQVLDTTSGGIHALLRLGLRQPTRFIYDFHFFHDVGDPRIRALRAELMAGLATGRPAAVVVLEESWPGLGYERLAGFPDLARTLETSFTLAITGQGYRIYAKRSDS